SSNAYYQHDHPVYYPWPLDWLLQPPFSSYNYHHACEVGYWDSNWYLSENECRQWYGQNPAPCYSAPFVFSSALDYNTGLNRPSFPKTYTEDRAAQYLYSRNVCIASATGYRESDDRATGLVVKFDESDYTTPKTMIYVSGYFQGGSSDGSSTFDFRFSDGTNTKNAMASDIGNKDLFVLKIYDQGPNMFGNPAPVPNPSVKWLIDSSGTTSNDSIWANAIAMDPDGDLYIAGGYKNAPKLGATQLHDTTGGTTAPVNAFVARLFGGSDVTAAWQWARSAGPTSTANVAEAFSLSVDKLELANRGVYATGNFKGNLQLYDNGSVVDTITAKGNAQNDAFVAKYSAGSGGLAWATRGGLYDDENVRSIVADGSGTNFIAGSFRTASSFIEGSTMSFDGSKQQYIFGEESISDTSYSVAFWFKTGDPNAGILSITNGAKVANGDRDIWLSNGNLKAKVFNSTEEIIQTVGSNFADNQWHYAVHTFGGAITQKLYVDGIERASGTKTSSSRTVHTGVTIAYASSVSGTNYFTGMISGLEFGNVLSALTIMDNFIDPNNKPNNISSGKILFSAGNADIFLASVSQLGRWRESEVWTVGQEVPMPDGAVAMKPEFMSPDSEDNFFWSEYSKKLYSVWGDVGAVIKWRISTDLLNFSRVLSTGVSKWPDKPQMHVAGVPVELQPSTTTYSYTGIQRTGNSATDTQKNASGGALFNASKEGYSVIRYGNGGFDLINFPVAFEIVKTYFWDNTTVFQDDASCTVGQRITDFVHNDPLGKNGYVYFNKSFHDGYGTKRSYDKETRMGPIIPVNEVTTTKSTHLTDPDAGRDMVVVWSETNLKNIPWPVRSVRYDCKWPADSVVYKIIIASELGSDVLNQPALDTAVYPDAYIYRQPDSNQAGYNPNEEHASLFPSATGNGFAAVFALRNDLYNPLTNLPSKPYVMLKYKNPADNQWSMLTYKVLTTGYGYNSFNYQGTAGTTINPPYPIRLLSGCPQSFGEGDPYWQDSVNNQYWARSAGTVTARYYYPLLSDFDYPNNPTLPQIFDGSAGQCVGWLDRRSGGGGQPIGVSYSISWPADVPVLHVGETLLTAKRGLPDIVNQAGIKVVYDELDPNVEDPNNSLVQLIDPLSPRELLLDDGNGIWVNLPSEISTSEDSGQLIFNDLPFHLMVRFYYNPLTRKLGFKGYFDNTGMGDPLLLINVMSASELDELLALSDDEDYVRTVKALFNLTRNPQKLRLQNASGVRPVAPQSVDLTNWENLDSTAKRTLLQSMPSLIGLQDFQYDTEKQKMTDLNGNFLSDGVPERLEALGGGFALTAGAAAGTGFVTLAFNDDASLGSLPVSLQIIRVDCAPYQGQIQVVQSDIIFDEKLVLRHSGDFGGRPENFEFEWYYHPDPGTGRGPEPPPTPETDEFSTATGRWLPFNVPDPFGAIDITIKGATETTISDNWFYVRYKGYPVCNNTSVATPWAGDPSGTADTPRPQLAEGWIKRVLRALNPFEARVKDFAAAPTNTFGSMLIQLGERYEGAVAMNNDPDNLNSMGLISAYETVLRRGIGLSIGGTPPINYAPANAALLLAASRISDFYMLLGNEAYGDAQDPTIGFGTNSIEYGSESSSIFAFQNQVDSLLEEELTLLRGFDYRSARPVYNRAVWNFTSNDGEVAYSQVYNIKDMNGDGFIDEYDARIMFPQGHGDAWGHYLTAAKGYYRLLRHPFYTWDPRAESVLVAGAPVRVDYLDERKFARVAAARAKAGAEIMNLTYRLKYVDDPAGQWQGYKDNTLTDPADPQSARAWGLSEWGRRTGQSAFFDWVVANSILPEVDNDPLHDPAKTGTYLTKIDRRTVKELSEIPMNFLEVQVQLDKADAGLNPLGLSRDVVPFDIDNTISSGMEGMTHFEQIYERANAALQNVVGVWDYANKASNMLRQNENTLYEFGGNVYVQEVDYMNRLIEIYGYPYAGDMGPTGTYPSDYDGPDLLHYMWIDKSELTGESAPPDDAHAVTLSFTPICYGQSPMETVLNPIIAKCKAPAYPPANPTTSNVTYRFSTRGLGIIKPDNVGQRKAEGEIQRAFTDLYLARNAYEVSLRNYENYLKDINDKVKSLEALYDFQTDKLSLIQQSATISLGLDAILGVMETANIIMRRISAAINFVSEDAAHCPPRAVGLAVDAGSPVACTVEIAGDSGAFALDTVVDVVDILKLWTEYGKNVSEKAFEISIERTGQNYEFASAFVELETLIRQEPAARLDVFAQKGVVQQAIQNYYAVLAKGERLQSEIYVYRAWVASEVQEARYRDMTFRIFRNDGIQKYRAQFDLASRYTYLAAKAYDYETGLLRSDRASGQKFLTNIVKQRSLGQMIDGRPVVGARGLSDPLSRLGQNFDILKGQLGFNNPQIETNRFSLKSELFRLTDNVDWRTLLSSPYDPAGGSGFYAADLWQIPEFRKYCRPFTIDSTVPQPGLVIPFSTEINFGRNFFGQQLGAGDSAYDPTNFATKIRATGVWFTDYDTTQLALTPRVYLIPTGMDTMRAPTGNMMQTRQWRVVDQKIPVPFPIGASDISNPDWIPLNDSLSDQLSGIRKFSSIRAYPDSGEFDASETTTDGRLIGRSVWNTKWMLIIPGGTLNYDPAIGLSRFLSGVSDIKIFFKTYGYSGN
ncbi:MAG: LamG domain-containing protein, partial [Nitrospirae bacterium]|nr:LamG domain-containing protein [Nitrospirota bacterium]